MKINRKILIGLAIGVISGILDVIPMILKHLSWDANLSAFSMWVVAGVLIASVSWPFNGILKGILISFMVLLPCAVLIGWKEPFSLIPISIITLLLGSLSGYFITRFTKD